MFKRASTLVVLGLLVPLGFGKDKKPVMPAYVLSAKTVAVIIDPTAGMSIEDPRANQDAQKDVEAALLSWGRFEPVISTRMADIIIVVRRGSGRMMNETIPDPRQNDRPGSITQTDNGISMGGQRGPQPGMSGGPGGPGTGMNQTSPSPRTEVGQADDSFVVYKGGNGDEKPLDSPAAWRYVAVDALSPHSVPAVAAFKKAVENAEKAASKNP
jgi:hypothetical protein